METNEEKRLERNERAKAYYYKNRAAKIAYATKYQKLNKEKKAVWAKTYRDGNKHKRRQWIESNRPRINATAAAYTKTPASKLPTACDTASTQQSKPRIQRRL